MTRYLFAFYICCTLAACSAPATQQQPGASATPKSTWQPPVAGTVVDRYQERITEDQLNEKYFRITILTTENSDIGEFKLKLEYGFNINETTIQLPEWTPGVILKPLLKKGAARYQCLLGFDTGDGQFHELYLVKADREQIALKQTRGYFKQ